MDELQRKELKSQLDVILNAGERVQELMASQPRGHIGMRQAYPEKNPISYVLSSTNGFTAIVHDENGNPYNIVIARA